MELLRLQLKSLKEKVSDLGNGGRGCTGLLKLFSRLLVQKKCRPLGFGSPGCKLLMQIAGVAGEHGDCVQKHLTRARHCICFISSHPAFNAY